MAENMKRARISRFDVRTMSPNSRPCQIIQARKRLDKNEIENYEKLTRSDFSTKQNIIFD